MRRQSVDRGLIWLSVEVFGQGIGKDMVSQSLKWRPVRDYPREECDRGVKLEIVGIAEDIANRAAVDSVDQSGAVAKPFAENGMNEVTMGLAGTGDGKALRHRTRTETCYLGKDEPHPVGLLLSGYQL